MHLSNRQRIAHRCTQNRNAGDVFSVVGKVLKAVWFYCHLGEFVCAFVLYVELDLFLVNVNWPHLHVVKRVYVCDGYKFCVTHQLRKQKRIFGWGFSEAGQRHGGPFARCVCKWAPAAGNCQSAALSSARELAGNCWWNVEAERGKRERGITKGLAWILVCVCEKLGTGEVYDVLWNVTSTHTYKCCFTVLDSIDLLQGKVDRKLSTAGRVSLYSLLLIHRDGLNRWKEKRESRLQRWNRREKEKEDWGKTIKEPKSLWTGFPQWSFSDRNY